jgi:ATP-dependent exoDNAse (exonuclease V) beta subunit
VATDIAGLLSADEHARAAALEVTRSFIVQAPAGSGKTELLIQRYLTLLATVDEPEEILAITFTRKAAAEMQLRIVEALERPRDGRSADVPHRRITAKAAAAALARDHARGWALAENPGRMRILTIDALNASIARMLPLTSPTGGGAAIIEDYEMERVYRSAAAATLDWLGGGDDNERAVRDVLEHMDGNTAVYIEQLSRMLANRDQWLPFVRSGRISDGEAQHLREEAERHLRSLVARALRGIGRLLPDSCATALPGLARYAGTNLRAAGNTVSAIVVLADGMSFPSATPEELAHWIGVAELLLTDDGQLRRQVDARLGFPRRDRGEKAAMLALLANLESEVDFLNALAALRELPPLRYADAQWAMLLRLFRVLPIAIHELQRLFLARSITDHVEVALSAAAALGTPDEPGNVALLMDHAIRHILVDEMQDTSRAQYRLLEALTGGWEQGDGRTLFCVGDPMQSIYGFRNADVAQFLQARQHGIGTLTLEPLVLRQNFRSGELLVDWFNETFPLVLPRVDDPLHGAIAYTASAPAPALEGQGEVIVHPGFGTGVEQEAERGASVIRRLVSEQPGDSLAVLVRSRTQLPALLRRLRALGIPYESVDIDRLTDLPEVIELLALTRVLVHRGDRVAWLGLLRAPWIGLDWTDLHELVVNSGKATVLELLREPGRRASLSSWGREQVSRVLPILEEAMDPGRTEYLYRRVERLWYRLGGPALLADADAVNNAYQYLSTLAKLESAGTLPEISDLYELLDAERVSTSSGAGVQVMTMHKAKGLQFDHVVLYATGRHAAGNRPAILSWLDLPDAGEGGTRLFSPIGRRDEEGHDPLHRFLERTAKARTAHEDGRLLYVACTRARKSLHIVGQVGLRDDGHAWAMPRSGTLLRLLWPVVEEEFARAFAAPTATLQRDDDVYGVPVLRRLARTWLVPEAMPLAVQQSDGADRADELKVEYDWVGLDARLAGTVVHRWLQRLAETPGYPDSAFTSDFEPTCRRWLAELGASAALHEGITSRVRSALENVLGDERGRWILAGAGHTELALTGLYGGRVQSIVIDRVRIDSDGTHWIIDYKTGSHEGGVLDGFLHAETERYRLQLERYAAVYRNYAGVPVRCALYFPLLARFVEVAPLNLNTGQRT